MDLEEFIEKENVLKDMALELMLLEKKCNELRADHIELFRMLRAEARYLKIKVQDGQFIVS